MFKLIFKVISVIGVLILIVVALSVWKGGEPFYWLGKKTVEIGKSIEEFGDLVDEVIKGQKKAAEKFKELKEELDSIKEGTKESEEPENGAGDRNQESE